MNFCKQSCKTLLLDCKSSSNLKYLCACIWNLNDYCAADKNACWMRWSSKLADISTSFHCAKTGSDSTRVITNYRSAERNLAINRTRYSVQQHSLSSLDSDLISALDHSDSNSNYFPLGVKCYIQVQGVTYALFFIVFFPVIYNTLSWRVHFVMKGSSTCVWLKCLQVAAIMLLMLPQFLYQIPLLLLPPYKGLQHLVRGTWTRRTITTSGMTMIGNNPWIHWWYSWFQFIKLDSEGLLHDLLVNNHLDVPGHS